MNDIIEVIKNSSKVAVLPHIMVDGDGLGSSLALAMAINKLGKQACVYIEEDVPETYLFMPGMDNLKIWNGNSEEYDLIIALDTGDMDRLGERGVIFKKATTTVNIDHHKTNTLFAQYNYVNASASSVGEIIYQLLKMMNIEISKDMAICMYTALATDTGGFRYSNTSDITHHTAADLISKGIDVAEISRLLFETVSIGRVKLMGVAVSNIELLENGAVSVIMLDKNRIKASGAREEDAEGIVNYARNIRGVEVGVLIKQRENGEIRVNLRSNRYVDVSMIAKKFGGGGHQRAAGCTMQVDITCAKEQIMNEIRNVI